MRRWFALTVMVLAAAMCRGAEDWVAQELRDGTQLLSKKYYGRAFALYHNLLLVNRAAPLDSDQADQAKRGLAAAAVWVKVKNPGAANAEFAARAKTAGFVSVGAAWMPPGAKARLSAEAARSLEKAAQAPACPDCKGQGVEPCANCDHGRHRCPTCLGTGRTGGAIASGRGAPCVACNATGRLNCSVCGGTGFLACDKCSGTGLGN
ncbi:MAG: hypothetical protein FJ388_05525 [Verrucomicrobia bacterium]|nr:hypothetical protein [Verrucomicrobiota bacterium]